MEQRPLRLGDILDDYCPRERRLTNHAIVAMVGEDVKQTRCTTCDAEHAFKGGRQPRRRKKDGQAALYDEVLAGMSESEVAVAAGAADTAVPAPNPPAVVPPVAPPSAGVETGVLAARNETPLTADEEDPVEDEQPEDLQRPEEGPVHRRLIRATLPRPEGFVKEPRPMPEFTIHRNAGRNGQFRAGQHRGNGSGNGGDAQGHRSPGRRFAGGGSGQGLPGRGGQGRPDGFRGGPSAQRPGGGGKKRSR